MHLFYSECKMKSLFESRCLIIFESIRRMTYMRIDPHTLIQLDMHANASPLFILALKTAGNIFSFLCNTQSIFICARRNMHTVIHTRTYTMHFLNFLHDITT